MKHKGWRWRWSRFVVGVIEDEGGVKPVYDDSGDMTMPVDEYERQLTKQHFAMANSGDETLRQAGLRYLLRKLPEIAADWRVTQHVRRLVNPENARKLRRKRGKTPQTRLKERALGCVLRDHPGITAGKLCTILDADGRLTFDDDDVELQPHGDSILIRDLNSDTTATVKKSSLRTYLSNVAKLSER